MPDSVVNLLDLRDEEENQGGKGGGGRWANRPKGKAKAGGRNRRKKREDEGKTSGFGGRQRLNSQASNVSDYSEDGEEDDAQAKVSQASAPRGDTSHPLAHSSAQEQPAEQGGRNELFSQLQQDPMAAPSQDITKAMLENDEEAQRGGGLTAPSDGGGEIFAEARKIAKFRVTLQNDQEIKPGIQGPLFKQSVWEYYMVKGTWSDQMCVALNHSNMLPCFLAPCLWPYRLFLTVKRAAPIKIKLNKCCNCEYKAMCAFPLVLLIFSLPILAVCLFIPQVATQIASLLRNIPNVPDDEAKLNNWVLGVSIGLCLYLVWLCVFWWARVLAGVARRYTIMEVIDKPEKFHLKTMGCICCMNMRVGAHVDRAQGFEKILKSDQTTVELSDTMRMVSPPQQGIMV